MRFMGVAGPLPWDAAANFGGCVCVRAVRRRRGKGEGNNVNRMKKHSTESSKNRSRQSSVCPERE